MIQPQRRRQADRRQEAVEKILDSAEAIFAANGFNGTTLNEVAKSVDVDTALLRYYFSDKEGLFDAVFDRRAPVINAIRVKALDRYEREMGGAMSLEGIIDAFTRPVFELMAADEGWRNFSAIVAYVNSSRGALRQIMTSNFDPASRRVIALMMRVLPDADEREVYWAYHYFTGAFTLSIGQTGRIDVLSDGKISSLDFLAVADRLVITLAAGMRALCTRDPALPMADDILARVGMEPAHVPKYETQPRSARTRRVE